jgi:ADP-dependent NAD(P)H-hydrate dehydratase / NAD(P)H-hydrate epimerase
LIDPQDKHTMPKILTVEQMRALEAAADAAGYSYSDMMERAGRAIAKRVSELMKKVEAERDDGQPPRVAVLVGKGNNGGDGLVAARFLKEYTNALVTVFLTEAREDDLVTALRDSGVLIADAPTDAEQGYRVLKTMVGNSDILIDAILGTGAKLPIKGELEKILRQVHKALHDRQNDRPAPDYVTPAGNNGMDELIHAPTVYPIIIATDIPTGLDADTGALDQHAIHAHETITMEAAKPGLLLFPGAEAVGTLHIAPLGLPAKIKAESDYDLIDAAYVKPLLPKRKLDANKGTFGKVMVAAGSINYTGAPALAASAAYNVGAGLVTVAAPQPIIPMIGAHLPEATWLVMPHDMGVFSKGAARTLREGLDGYTALLVGPGLAQEKPTTEFIEAFFAAEAVKAKSRVGFGFAPAAVIEEKKPETELKPLPPLVIDADGLNLLAKLENWQSRLPARTILTPHAGEFGRLAGFTDDDAGKATDKVQADRVNLARDKAAAWNMIIVLKGAFTVIADPEGRVAVLPFANPALAKAGTGDVLAGMIAGLLGQGLDPYDAAVAGAYLHGLAGAFAGLSVGDQVSAVASDVIENISLAFDSALNAG